MNSPELLDAEIGGTGPNGLSMVELREGLSYLDKSVPRIGTTVSLRAPVRDFREPVRYLKFTFTTEEQLEEFRAA